MMGRNHVLSGALVGTLTLPLVDLDSPVLQVGWVVLVAGAVLIPDWDTPSSSASTMWGPLSGAIHSLVALVSGGHRWGTHDIVLAPLVVTALAVLARQDPIASGIAVAIVVGLMLQGLATSRLTSISPVLNLACSIAAALLLPQVAGDVEPLTRIMPLALALGVAVAILGDFVTEEGVPVPVVWIVKRCRVGLGLFRVDRFVENVFVSTLLLVTLVAAIGNHLDVIDIRSTIDALK